MPFGLTNAPSTFISKTLDELVEHLYVALNVLRKNKLNENLKKYSSYLEFCCVFSLKGISVNEEKIKAIRE
ncbi:hypothetical protein CR513_45397, partial [Mucuna pruriens]